MKEKKCNNCKDCICDKSKEELEKEPELKAYCEEYDFHLYVKDKDGNHKKIDPSKFGKKKE